MVWHALNVGAAAAIAKNVRLRRNFLYIINPFLGINFGAVKPHADVALKI